MTRKLVYGALVFFMVVMGFTACTEDDEFLKQDKEGDKVTLEMMPYVHSNLPEICVQTRTDENCQQVKRSVTFHILSVLVQS